MQYLLERRRHHHHYLYVDVLESPNDKNSALTWDWQHVKQRATVGKTDNER